MQSLGGFVSSSAVIIWAFICPLGALVFSNPSKAHFWYIGFIALVSLSGFLQSDLLQTDSLTAPTITFFFVANIGTVSFLIFMMLRYFIMALRKEQARSNELLHNVLPAEIVPLLKEPTEETFAVAHDSVSVLFADLVDFTSLPVALKPDEMVNLLNTVFTFFDSLVAKYHVKKLRTIGDNYMVIAGAPRACTDHANRLANMALDMLDYLESPANPAQGKLQFRIGINSGPVIAGVIGKTKFQYDVWGDTVNIASRMESHGQPNKIQITKATGNLLGNGFYLRSRGEIEIKGKGRMETWFLEKAIN